MEEVGADKDVTFANVLAVLEWLQEGDWKISKSNLYVHAREGLLLARKDGKYHLRDVSKYAKLYLKKKEGRTPRSKRFDSLQEKRVAAETRKMEAQARMAEIKAKALEGFYVERTSFERALAARAAVFKNDIMHWIHADVPHIVHLCSGDRNKIPELIEYICDQAETWLDRYSGDTTFSVPSAAASIPHEILDTEVDDDQIFGEEDED